MQAKRAPHEPHTSYKSFGRAQESPKMTHLDAWGRSREPQESSGTSPESPREAQESFRRPQESLREHKRASFPHPWSSERGLR